MEMPHVSAQQANRDDSGQRAFFDLQDFKLRLGPDFSLIPLARCAEAAHACDRRGFLRQVFELQARKRRGACRYGEQRESPEKKNPQESAALYVTHFRLPRDLQRSTSAPLAAVWSRFVF